MAPPPSASAPPDEEEGPYIPAGTRLPEITVKGVTLGLLLAVTLGAANTYLGLKAGLTVAASIPAAVLSLAVLRAFRNHSVLEHTLVQTIASAGTSVASGALFTIPALLILGKWQTIHYWETTLIVITGGLLGVLFTVPIRRALIIEEKLPFPEGLATGEVLKAGERGGTGVGALLFGGLVGAFYKFVQGGLKLWNDGTTATIALGDRAVMGVGATMSPALVGVGAIVGLPIATLVLLGGAISWFIGIPLYTQFAHDVYSSVGTSKSLADIASGGGADLPTYIWKVRIRYLGVGAMLVGGVWSLVKLAKPLTRAVQQGLKSARGGSQEGTLRTERELPFLFVGLGVLVLALPMFLYYAYFLHGTLSGMFTSPSTAVAGVLTIIMLVTGFFFSAVGAYMAGIVGSSNSPISGVTILTLLMAAFVMVGLGVHGDIGPAAAVVVAAVICCAGSIAGDNLQDLKAGHILGSTPWKQQLMLMVGAVASAFFIAPVMQILVNGAGGPGAIGGGSLAAPQSTLMASVSQAIFGAGLPYGMIGIGMALAVVLILIDSFLANSGSTFRTPVMPVAVGIYLPVGLSIPIFVGGVAAWAANRFYRRMVFSAGMKEERGLLASLGERTSILFSSGLIAGEAIVGIATAFLVASTGVKQDSPLAFTHIVAISTGGAIARATYDWAGLLLLAYVVYLAYYVAIRPGIKERASWRGNR
ncbi:MAG: OPT family oligopeptide transporter [Thermoplasmatota archaeon]